MRHSATVLSRAKLFVAKYAKYRWGKIKGWDILLPLRGKVRQRRREWDDRVSRMREEIIARTAIDGKDPRRPPGRPPKRWMDSWIARDELKARTMCSMYQEL
ncbi:PREDICTED: uncharacterized protein LOC105566568 [Vollenhovia emeryi]|uniref:uncharacterized protein LOC105566568 n=1 Tax=Vollenhovia emeryi TaxID=411798 RepID=UPI0005F4FD19|nr:PREDICTED: uncharacterized protein LOC105566568 [Vollenhovia emeryi]XP_011876063.1 PREDICTED: uncharacterized protein LOC105566568 [Vollenhovia emeryi]XP_011876064.1 PREDICTED: uncharacterized protein LOC105566568 [Vollenhovia emeryi]